MKTFIEEQQEVNELLGTLEPTGENVGYERELLTNPKSGEKWEKYLFEYEGEHIEGIGLRKHPPPSIKETIEIALFTEHDDEADGAAACLLDYDNEGKFRELLIERLEKTVKQVSLERFEMIYNRAALYSNTNKRSIIGKHHTEVCKDSEYFVSLVNRAKALKLKYI